MLFQCCFGFSATVTEGIKDKLKLHKSDEFPVFVIDPKERVNENYLENLMGVPFQDFQ